MFENLQPFALSFFIGLLIGIERERSHPAGFQAMGVRTFVLLAVLGTLTATIDHPFISVLLAVFAFAAILLGYFRTTGRKKIGVGLTTEFAAAVVFCLGYLATREPLLVALIGLAVLFVLLGREKLHTFSRQQLKPQEIRAATTVLVILFGILPFLPNHTIDMWHLFNPFRFGVLVLIIALLQFGSYVAMRMFGERLGMLLTGFFGGFVSSTAVFVTLPHMVRNRPELTRASVAAALLATVAMLLEFCLIIFIAAPLLLTTVFWPITIMIGTGIVIAFLMAYGDGHERMMSEKTVNPLDVPSVLRLACFIGGMVFLVGLAEFYLGEKGAILIAFLGGLFELHGVTYATATLHASGKLAVTQTTLILGSAILATFLTKFVLLLSLARNRFAVLTSIFLFVMLALGWSAYFYFT